VTAGEHLLRRRPASDEHGDPPQRGLLIGEPLDLNLGVPGRGA
jgi:hypothetical protein